MLRLRSPLARWSRARVAAVGCGVLAVVGSVGLGVEVATSVERVDAVWAIRTEIGESSLIVPIEATHPTCPAWTSLGGLLVEAVETDEVVTITATFPEHHGLVCDDDGRTMPTTVRLHSPLADRTVVDGATGLDPATPDAVALIVGEAAAAGPTD